MLSAVAASSGPAATSELTAWVEDVRAQAKIPGLAVVVVRSDGEPTYVCSGVDAEGAAITPSTVFAMGSLSKSFTALAVMLLIERGLVTLDQSASSFVPELDARITIRQLLHQTSGIPGADGFWLGGGTLEARVHGLKGRRLTGPPGKSFQYSNANYDVLGLVIERVGKKPYARFMREDVLGPLGLTQVWSYAELGRVPRGHQDWFGLYRSPRAADEWSDATTPAGGLFATADGLGRALRVHLTDGRSTAPPLVSEAGFRMLHEVGTDEANSYAMGWTVRQLDGQPMVVHSGQTGEFTSTMAFFPKAGFAVAALANVNGVASPITRLAVRDIVPGVAQITLGKAPTTSSLFGYRNQPAIKSLLLAIGIVSIGRSLWRWRRRDPRPRWHAALDLALALGLLFGVPRLAQIPLGAMLRFNPDLATLLVLGAALACVRAARTASRGTPTGSSTTLRTKTTVRRLTRQPASGEEKKKAG
ncbi:MAG: serine hydrolase domain-containing protein [Polyangiales bacterium]